MGRGPAVAALALALGGVAAAQEPAPAAEPSVDVETARRWAAEDGLEAAIARFEALVDAPWAPLGDGPPLREGDVDDRVPALRRRLELLGEIAPEAVPDAVRSDELDRTYEPHLVLAVRAAQRHHGLEDDGVVGRKTIEALDVPPAERAARLRETLAGLRALPTEHPRAVVVNLPEYVLRRFEDGAEVGVMRVVVGDVMADRSTPTLHAALTDVVFNPYWNVPYSIATEELVDDGPVWLATHGYEAVEAGSGAKVPLDAGALARVQAGAVRLRQKPGGANALGEVKFLFPNPHDVYLHDTPSKGLFAKEIRAFSHGCIRVEDPLGLAAWLLGPQGWTGQAVSDATRGDRERRVRLDAPVAVHVVEWPAWVAPDGAVFLAPRPYRP